jgi:hypothetical protein
MFGVSQILEDITAHPDYRGDGFVPFADDEFNNRYVWERSTGKVHFIDYSHRSGARTEVAQSFGEFIDRVRVTPD